MSLTLFPAVDVASGRASQVLDGAASDPLAVAMGFVEAGAHWLHVVDLDRAFGRGENLDLLRDLIKVLPVPVQLSGGITDAESLQAAASTDARRFVLASTAILDLSFIADAVAHHGSAIVLGLDVRGDMVIARGSDVTVGAVSEVIRAVAQTGVSEFVVADADRDGSRAGVNSEMFASVTASIRALCPQAHVVASGGVASIDDLCALNALVPHGLRGVILGAAVHQGAFTLPEAQAAITR